MQVETGREYKMTKIFTPNTVISSTDVNANFADSIDVTKHINPYKARAYLSASHTIADNVLTKVNLNAETYDTNSNFDTGNYRYTAPVTGYYQVNGSVYMSGTGINQISAVIYVNGALSVYGSLIAIATGSNISVVSDTIYVVAGQYVELYAFADVTAGVPTVMGGAASFTYMSIHLVSAT